MITTSTYGKTNARENHQAVRARHRREQRDREQHHRRDRADRGERGNHGVAGAVGTTTLNSNIHTETQDRPIQEEPTFSPPGCRNSAAAMP